ncbi:MAG: protein kinase [Planctomycetes bacterium]|nr:protein kinase [Planctomycetota bacterium]
MSTTRALDAFEQAEVAAVRAALQGGWLEREALRAALLLREELRSSGGHASLLPLLQERLPPEGLVAARAAYARALATSGERPPRPSPPPQVSLELSQRALLRLRHPEDDDPEPVRAFLAATGETTRRLPGDAPPLPLPADSMPVTASWRPGEAAAPPRRRTIGGHELLCELGRGGMGRVYRARDLRLGREVALKTLLVFDADPETLARFEVEARAAARVQHPGVVAVHGAGVDDGVPWLAMQLVEGESLKARLAREGPLEPTHAAGVAEALARALGAAHAVGVLHRDLKPHNVLLAEDGAPLLTDFGLAKRLDTGGDAITVTGQVLGTPAYMAPEQAEGRQGAVDARTDVYGLGATLYEMLTGRPPFSGTSAVNVLAAVMGVDPTPPSALRPGVPPELEAICLMCLAKAPAARYPTAAALAADLRRLLDGEPVRARPEGRLRRLLRRARGQRAAVTRAAVWGGVTVGAAVTLGGVTAAREAAAERLAREWVVATAVEAPASELARADALVKHADALPAAWRARWRDAVAALHVRRGRALLEAGDPDRAARDFEAALQLAPDDRDALLGMARAGYRTGRLEAVSATVPLLLARDPDDLEALELRAWARAGTGSFDEALADAERVLLRAPGRPVALAARAIVRVERRQHEAAAADLEAALADARLPWLVATLADLHARRGDGAAATPLIEEALRLQPGLAWAWTVRARARVLGGDVAGALQDLDESVRLSPFNPSARQTRIEVNARLGRWREVVADADDALERGAPQPDGFLVARAGARLQLGDARAAVADVTQALELRPTLEAHMLRARARVALGQHAEAERDLEAALRLAPGHGLLLADRGRVRELRGDLAGARADLEAAVERMPRHPQAWLHLGLLRAQAGDLEGAEAALSRAVELEPGNGGFQAARAAARAVRGELAGAQDDLRRAEALLPPGHPALEDARRALAEARERAVSPPAR